MSAEQRRVWGASDTVSEFAGSPFQAAMRRTRRGCPRARARLQVPGGKVLAAMQAMQEVNGPGTMVSSMAASTNPSTALCGVG